MEVFVNGESHKMPMGASVLDLLMNLSLVGKRVAIELDGEIVPKGLHAQTMLQHGNRLEIVVAVGGG